MCYLRSITSASGYIEGLKVNCSLLSFSPLLKSCMAIRFQLPSCFTRTHSSV